MRATIHGPQSLKGEVNAPGSKAYTHRALVASLMTSGATRIKGALDCDDTRRTLEGVRALGAKLYVEDDVTVAHGASQLTPDALVDCGNSGATLRFLVAVASAFPTTTTFVVNRNLATRPLTPLLQALEQLGAVSALTQGRHQLIVRGPLKGGETVLPGDISSQFVSGLLLAAPASQKDVQIRMKHRLESRHYVDMTIELLRRHGIKVDVGDDTFLVPAPQHYQSAFHKIEGDFSSAAFLMAAAASWGDSICIHGLAEQSLEPDSTILKIAPQLGLELYRKGGALVVKRSSIQSFRFDASNNPDLVPVLEVLGCAARGISEITGLRRLRFKESNRLLTVPMELSKMGGRIHIDEDHVKIEPKRLSGARLDSYHDHRVAMACSIAALGAHGDSVIENVEAVSKSYPDFFGDLSKLGAEIHVE